MPAVATITLTIPSPIMAVGRSDPVAAVIRDSAGHTITGPTVAWSSSDAAVVSVDSTGKVTALAPGSANVMAHAGSTDASLTIDVAPASTPFLHRPFEGTYALVNPVDHDLPLGFADDNGVQVESNGEQRRFEEGHEGYDWGLPLGTPVLAADEGIVNFAGTETPFACPLLNGRVVAAMIVNVVHQAPTGELFATEYVHLSRIDVAVGDTVKTGQQVGLSGTTGCSTGPHLHFQVARQLFTRDGSKAGVIADPYGWTGQQDDPWLLSQHGAVSSYLWLPGAAPQGLLSLGAFGPEHPSGTVMPTQSTPADIERFQPSLYIPKARK